MFEFVQNNNNARSGFTLLQNERMVSNLLRGWRDDFVTVKKQRHGFGAYQKETACHPTSSHPTSSTVYNISNLLNVINLLTVMTVPVG
jgi:hypothetical protein